MICFSPVLFSTGVWAIAISEEVITRGEEKIVVVRKSKGRIKDVFNLKSEIMDIGFLMVISG